MLSRKQALLAIWAMFLGSFNAARVSAEPALLTIPLDQWRGLRVEYGGKSIYFTAKQVFDALQPARTLIFCLGLLLWAGPAQAQDRGEGLSQAIVWGGNVLDLGTHYYNYKTVWCNAERPSGCLYEGNPVMNPLSEQKRWGLKLAGTAAQSYLVHFAHKKGGWKAGLLVAIASGAYPAYLGVQNIRKGNQFRKGV